MNLSDLLNTAAYQAEDWGEFRLVDSYGRDITDVVFDTEVNGTAMLIHDPDKPNQ